jgi:hypothetical protein
MPLMSTIGVVYAIEGEIGEVSSEVDRSFSTP